MRVVLLAFIFLIINFNLTFSSSDKEKINIAVMELTGQGIDKSARIGLTNIIISTISENYKDRYNILERDQIDYILKEQGFQQAVGCNDVSCAVEIGQLLGVSYLIIGNVEKIGQLYIITLKIVNVSSAKIEKVITKEFKGRKEKLVKLIKFMTIYLIEGDEGVKELVSKYKGNVNSFAETQKGLSFETMQPPKKIVSANEACANAVFSICCLGDIRLGYYLNQGYELKFKDVIQTPFFPLGRLYTSVCVAGSKGGVEGCCAAWVLGLKAGEDIRKYKLRKIEKLVCATQIAYLIPTYGYFIAYPLQMIVEVYILYEVYSGKTWYDVVKSESLNKI